MKKIVVFGATGNVGSYFTKYAVEYFKGRYEVVASGRRQTDFWTRHGVAYCSADISKPEDFARLPQSDVHAVVYLAAQIPSYMEGYQPQQYVAANMLGAFNVLEYCRRVKAGRVLFSTTVFDQAEYVKDENVVLRPDMPLNFSYTGDHALYVISKNTALELLEHYHQEYGIGKFVFRFPTIYGYSPYHYYYPKGVKTLRPVYRMIDLAKAGEPIELWGDPNYAKDMVHVYDCAQMMCRAVEANRDRGFYNVGTGMPVTLREQIETIIKVFSPKDKPSPIVLRPDKKAGGGFLMDIENAKTELGYEPQYDCYKLFASYKEEMAVDRFKELRMR